MWDATNVVFGVRHKKRFSFLDYAGQVLDSVIEMQEAGELPTGVVFQAVGWQKTIAQLKDAKGAITVDFNIDGIVLTVDPIRSRLPHEAAKRLFLALAAKVLPITGGEDRINRIGTMQKYEFNHQGSGEVVVAALTTLGSLGSAADVAIRLSFRTPTEDGLVQRDVNDWRNTIIQVWNRQAEETDPDLTRLDISIDYQTYFAPARQYAARLIEEHDRHFVNRLEALQSGGLAGLAGNQVAR